MLSARAEETCGKEGATERNYCVPTPTPSTACHLTEGTGCNLWQGSGDQEGRMRGAGVKLSVGKVGGKGVSKVSMCFCHRWFPMPKLVIKCLKCPMLRLFCPQAWLSSDFPVFTLIHEYFCSPYFHSSCWKWWMRSCVGAWHKPGPTHHTGHS